MVDAAIQRVFRAGLNLAACAGMVKGVAAGRLAEAITDLDTVIVELRKAALAPPPRSADRPGHRASEHHRTRSSSQHKGAAVATKRAAKPPTVAVTFTLPAAVDAKEVALCGEFNGWSPDDLKLARNGDGGWEASLRLAPGAYRYRYLLDGTRWENAWDADDYVANPYGEDDSVIVVAG